MNRTQRWPLHPTPEPLESLSSWISRLARLYHLPVKVLLGNLDLDVVVPWDLDHDPPEALLVALAQRTGMDLAQLRAMTLAGWEFWLLDALYVRRWNAQATFDAYVRDNSVLLAPGQAGTNDLSRWERWSGPWKPGRHHDRICPVCTADPDRGTALAWRLPLMVGCVEHGCRLEDAKLARPAVALAAIDPVPVTKPVATLDRYTYQALTAGRVSLPAAASTPACGSGYCARCWTRSAWP